MPDLTCTASGQQNVTVANSAGATVFQNGPIFPRALSITSTSLDPSPPGADEDLTINLANFRPRCNFTVTIEPGPLPTKVLSATADKIVVRIRPPNSVAPFTLKVQTPYGVATKVINLGGLGN